MNPWVQGLLAIGMARRSVRREKGPPDPFLDPSHPISRMPGQYIEYYKLDICCDKLYKSRYIRRTIATMDDNILMSNLYVNRISITKEIPAGNYLNRLPMVQNLKKMGGINLNRRVTFLVGENGVGKSTLIEAIAVAMGFNPEGGSLNLSFNTRKSHSDLHNYLTVAKGYKRHRDGFFLRAESFYNVASHIDHMDEDVDEYGDKGAGGAIIANYGGVSLHRQSHGESFMALVENRFGGNGLYILDEPEAALSPTRLMRLMYCIHQLVQQDSQFIISTHSPILMTYPGAEILEISNEGIRSVDYRDTEHYVVTKRFMDVPEKMVNEILGVEGELGE